MRVINVWVGRDEVADLYAAGNCFRGDDDELEDHLAELGGEGV